MKGERINILIALLVIGIIAAFIFTQFEYKQVKDHDWVKSYDPKSYKTYGLAVFDKLLKDKLGKENVVIDNTLNFETLNDSNYAVLVFDSYSSLSEQNNIQYIDYLNKGNDLYLFGDNVSINYIGLTAGLNTTFIPQLIDTIVSKKGEIIVNMGVLNKDTSYLESVSILKLYNNSYDDEPIEESDNQDDLINDSINAEVETESDSLYEADSIENEEANADVEEEYTAIESDTLLYYKNKPLFQRVNVYNGRIYLHSFPQLYTNIAAINEESYANHFNVLLNELKGKKVIFTSSLNKGKNDNPLAILLKNKSLATAYYLILFTLLLYLIFASKREQRPIPIIEPVKNTSLEYIGTLAQLYELQSQNHKLVKKMKETFYHTMFKKFYINPHEENYVKNLSKKSKISEELLNTTIKYFDHISQNESCSDEQLYMLNNYLSKIEKSL